MKFYLIMLISLTAMKSVQAAEWTVSGNVNQKLSYNDNVRLTKDEQGSLIYRITPVFKSYYKTPQLKLAGSASYGIQNYFDIPELDREHQNYELQGDYQTELIDYSLFTHYEIAPARNSAENDTGDFFTDAEKTVWSVSPTVSYQIAPLHHLRLSGSFSETSYSEGNFSDNENKLIDLAWQWQYSERYSGSVSVFFTQFDATQPRQDVTSNSFGSNLLTRYLLSEKWEMTGGLGVRFTDTEIRQQTVVGRFTTSAESDGFLSDTGFKYKGENLVGVFNLNRSLMPSGFGRVNEQTRYSLDLDYKLTERLSTSLVASYQTSESLRNEGNNSRKNMTIEPSISWKLGTDMTLSGRYRYRQQNNSRRGYTADSNTIMLTFDYDWQGLSLSR